MTDEEFNNHPGWQWCTFEGAELHTLLIGLKTTFREKLEWLEGAETLVLQMRAARLSRLAREEAEALHAAPKGSSDQSNQ